MDNFKESKREDATSKKKNKKLPLKFINHINF